MGPSDQSIKMEDITQIQVIQVSSSHIELSAVVCDESQCVTILVPVPFQHDCTGSCSDSEYECVLNNIDDLDDQAKQLLKRKSLGSRSEERELLRSLYDSTNLKYPHWWVSPQSPDMFGESQYMNIYLKSNVLLCVLLDQRGFTLELLQCKRTIMM